MGNNQSETLSCALKHYVIGMNFFSGGRGGGRIFNVFKLHFSLKVISFLRAISFSFCIFNCMPRFLCSRSVHCSQKFTHLRFLGFQQGLENISAFCNKWRTFPSCAYQFFVLTFETAREIYMTGLTTSGVNIQSISEIYKMTISKK